MKVFFHKINKIFTKEDISSLLFFLLLTSITPIIEAIGIGSLAALIIFFFESLGSSGDSYFDKLGLNPENFYFLSSIKSILTIVIVIFTLKGLYLIFFSYYETRFRNFLVANKSKEVFKMFMNYPYLKVKNLTKADVFNTAVVEAARVVDYIFGLILIFREVFLVTILFSSLFFFNPKYTIVLFLSLALFSLILFFLYNKKLYVIGDNLRKIQKDLLNLVNESISSFKILSLLNKKDYFINNFLKITDMRKKNIFFQQFLKKLPRIIFETYIIILISLIIIYFHEDKDLNEMLSFLAIMALIASRIMPSFTTLTIVYSTVKFNEASVDNYYKNFFSEKIITFDSLKINNSIINSETINNIICEKIFFSYDKGDKLLKNLNFEVKKGEIFGIFGRSGSGKSTLVDIISGLIKPDLGKILFNDNKIVNDNLKQWHSLLGYVPQNLLLINDTIANNICLGVDNKNQKKLNEIITNVGLNQLISKINKNQIIVGEGGIKLSEGQKQRISIARTLYFDPKIIILDESTSSLDSKAEEEILDLIFQLKKDRIIILISHNEKIKKRCDSFIDLDLENQND